MSLIKESELPMPRIELRWDKVEDDWSKRICEYLFIFPLESYDIRRERENEPDVDHFTVEIGSTSISGGRHPINGDIIDTPFRDGTHAKLDAKHFGNPPVYAVCDGLAMLIEYND